MCSSDLITAQKKTGEAMRWSYIREYQEGNGFTGGGEGSIINTERGMANGQRAPRYHILTEEEQANIVKDASDIGIPSEMLRFNKGNRTGYLESIDAINIRGDILPDSMSTTARDRMSSRAVLAHEYYGHRENSPSEYAIGDWRDEYRASRTAAISTPNLTERERADLMVDAYDRAREAGQPLEYDEEARMIIYGY